MKIDYTCVTPEYIYSAFKETFDFWCELKNMKHKKIESIKYEKINICAQTLDAWITTPPDESYREHEVYIPIDLEELEEYMEKVWNDEIGKSGIIDMQLDKNRILRESISLFNRQYKIWEREKKEFYSYINE